VVNRYEVFRTDIQPKGFEVIAFDDFITRETVRQVEGLLQDPARRAEMVEHNYEIGDRYYSYRTLERGLRSLLDSDWEPLHSSPASQSPFALGKPLAADPSRFTDADSRPTYRRKVLND
jgi:hypothetical protein